MSHGIHNKFVAVSGFISLTIAGCVHHTAADKSSPVTASAQGLPAPGLLARLSGKGGTGVVIDPSQWPEKPDESRTKAKFNQLFPHLSQRLERRSHFSVGQSFEVANQPPAVGASAQSAPAGVAVNEAAANPVAAAVANSVTPSAQTNLAAAAASPAVSASAQSAQSPEVGLPPVQESVPPDSSAAAPAPRSSENTAASKVDTTSSLPPIDAPGAPPEIKPTVVPENQPAAPAPTSVAPAPAPNAADLPARPAAPAPVANPAPVPPAPSAVPAIPAAPAPAPVANPAAPSPAAPTPAPAANPQPAVPAVPNPAPVPPPANPVPARPSAEPPARPEPKKPSEELSVAPPAAQSPVIPNPAENLTVPGIPAAEEAKPRSLVAVAPAETAEAKVPALPDSPPALNPPPVPAEEIVAKPVALPQTVAAATSVPPEIPAIPAVPQKPVESAPVAETIPATQPEPPGIPQLAMKPAAEVKQPALAKPVENVESAPLPPPAPEMDIPAIPEADGAQPALQSKEQTPDPGVKRLSADSDAAKQEVISTPAQTESASNGSTSSLAVEIKAPTDEQPVKVLQPLPDDEETEVEKESEKTSGILSRTESGLVIHLELKNPLRRWTNRQNAEPAFRPRVSGLASLRASTRELYEKSRTTLASRLGGGAPDVVNTDRQKPVEPAMNLASESAPNQAELPNQAATEVVSAKNEPEPPAETSQAVATEAQVATQPPAVQVQPVKASADSMKPASSTRTAAFAPATNRPRVVATTDSGLPPVEFPPTYGQNTRKTANPWAAHANPAVASRMTPDLFISNYDSLKSTKPGPENRRPVKTDRSIIATSLSVPVRQPEPVKVEAPKVAPSEKASSGPSLFKRAGDGLKALFAGEEEVVPAKRQSWATQNWSGTDRPTSVSASQLPTKNPGFNRLSPGL